MGSVTQVPGAVINEMLYIMKEAEKHLVSYWDHTEHACVLEHMHGLAIVYAAREAILQGGNYYRM